MMTLKDEAFEKMREAIANVIAVVDCLNPDRDPAREYHLGQATMNKLRQALALAEQARKQPEVGTTEGATTFNLLPARQLATPEPITEQPVPSASAVEMARLFHETYERLAPQFGYTTRDDTKRFDPNSPNGQLMTAVCSEVTAALQQENARLRARVAELEGRP